MDVHGVWSETVKVGAQVESNHLYCSYGLNTCQLCFSFKLPQEVDVYPKGKWGNEDVDRTVSDSLALLVQEVEQSCGLLADQVDAACVVNVVDVVPADTLGPVLLLRDNRTWTVLIYSSVIWCYNLFAAFLMRQWTCQQLSLYTDNIKHHIHHSCIHVVHLNTRETEELDLKFL